MQRNFHRVANFSLAYSYPLYSSYSKTLRGSGGDVLWLEEAAFMPPSRKYFFFLFVSVAPSLTPPYFFFSLFRGRVAVTGNGVHLYARKYAVELLRRRIYS